MSSFDMSPAKHKSESAKLRALRRTGRTDPGPTKHKRKPAPPSAATVEEFTAQGGRIEVIPCAWSEPTRYPRPVFARGKGGIG